MKNEDLAGMSLPNLIERYKAARESTAIGKLWTEIGARLMILRQHAEGHAAMTRALDGTPMSFTQLLDQLMEEMDAAGVADVQRVSPSEDEPHRARAYDLRAMLEERYEKLSGPASMTLDGK